MLLLLSVGPQHRLEVCACREVCLCCDVGFLASPAMHTIIVFIMPHGFSNMCALRGLWLWQLLIFSGTATKQHSFVCIVSGVSMGQHRLDGLVMMGACGGLHLQLCSLSCCC
jgi:hypothetical protein